MGVGRVCRSHSPIVQSLVPKHIIDKEDVGCQVEDDQEQHQLAAATLQGRITTHYITASAMFIGSKHNNGGVGYKLIVNSDEYRLNVWAWTAIM